MGNAWGDCLVGDNKIATINCVFPLFQNIVTAALIFAGVVALIFIIIAGLRLILSGGDAKKIEQSRKTLTFSIIGLVLILLSFAIIRFVSTVTGVGCINQFGFDQCATGGRTGQWGCFNIGGQTPNYACYPYASDNNPKVPRNDFWYDSQAACEQAC